MKIGLILICVLVQTSANASNGVSKFFIGEHLDETPVAELTGAQLKEDAYFIVQNFDDIFPNIGVVPQSEIKLLKSQIMALGSNPSLHSSAQFCSAIATSMDHLKLSHFYAGVWDAQKIQYQNCLVPQSPRRPSGGEVGKNFYKDPGQSGRPWQIETRLVNNIPISAVSVYLHSASDPKWAGFLNQLDDAIAKSQAFIIDLRSNPGGDSTYGQMMAAHFYGLATQSPTNFPEMNPSFTSIEMQTEAAYAGFANLWQYQILGYEHLSQTPPPFLATQRNYYLDLADRARSGRIPRMSSVHTTASPFNPANIVKKPILILQDGGCASSCEWTIDAFERQPFAKTVGTNTAGARLTGMTSNFYLKNSHVRIIIPNSLFPFDDGRNIEKVGYAPKVNVPLGKDAMSVAIDLIFQKRN